MDGEELARQLSLYFGVPIKIKSFNTEKEKNLLSWLQSNQHPSLPDFSSTLQAEGSENIHVPIKTIGPDLETFAEEKKGDLCNMHLISESYQKIIIDLMHLVRFLSESNVSAVLDKNIQVAVTSYGAPMICLVDFQHDEKKPKTAYWLELANFIDKINQILEYNPQENQDMRDFITYLRNGCCPTDDMEYTNCLASMPLFWTLRDRRFFVVALWDFVMDRKHDPMFASALPFASGRLAEFSERVEEYMPLVYAAVEPEIEKQSTESYLGLEETVIRRCLAFRSTCFTHWGEMVHSLQAMWQEPETRRIMDMRLQVKKDLLARLREKVHDLRDRSTTDLACVEEKKREEESLHELEGQVKLMSKAHEFHVNQKIEDLDVIFEAMFPQFINVVQKEAKKMENSALRTPGELKRVRDLKLEIGEQEEEERDYVSLIVPVKQVLLRKFVLIHNDNGEGRYM